MADMQDIDLLLKVLNDAEIKINYELIPQSGIAFTSDPPSVMEMPGVKSLVVIKQKDASGKVIHALDSVSLPMRCDRGVRVSRAARKGNRSGV